MKEEKIILDSSNEAAQLKTVTGWVSSTGRFFTDERLARYDGSTHSACECGNLMKRSWTKCDSCRSVSNQEKYKAMPFKEWDMKTPLVIFYDDKYFFDADEIEEYLEEHELKDEDLQLVICEPNYLSTIDSGNWEDVLPVDGDGELPKEVEKALGELNKIIEKAEPISWSEGKYRTEYKSQTE